MNESSSEHSNTPETAPSEPRYVGDVGAPLETPRDKAAVGIPLILFALALGFVVGALVCGLLSLANALVRLVWETGREAADVAWYPVAVCAAGGLVCGLWTKFVYEPPASLEEVMATVKRTGSYRMDSVPKGIVSFLLPLAFGGSVGPEAGLTGIIAAACTKVGALLSRAGVRAVASADLTISATLSAVFGAPFLGALASTEAAMPGDDARTYRRPVKVVLYTATAFGAFAGMLAVGLLPGAASGLPRFSAVNAGGAELLWFVPCVLAGWALAAVYHAAEHSAEKLRGRLSGHVIALPLACGLAMGVVALVFPDVLFSGEEQVRELVAAHATGGASAIGASSVASGLAALPVAAALLGTAVVKAVFTPLCLNCGWRGGHFFPMIFAGACLGFGIAALSGAEAMLCVTASVATLMGAIMRKPLAAGALLLLCFPAGSVLWLALAALIGSALPVPFAPMQKV